jgi:hypothetical protein
VLDPSRATTKNGVHEASGSLTTWIRGEELFGLINPQELEALYNDPGTEGFCFKLQNDQMVVHEMVCIFLLTWGVFIEQGLFRLCLRIA